MVGVAIAALYVFQEKMLYVPIVPGVPADYWVTADKYGMESKVGQRLCPCPCHATAHATAHAHAGVLWFDADCLHRSRTWKWRRQTGSRSMAGCCT